MSETPNREEIMPAEGLPELGQGQEGAYTPDLSTKEGMHEHISYLEDRIDSLRQGIDDKEAENRRLSARVGSLEQKVTTLTTNLEKRNPNSARRFTGRGVTAAALAGALALGGVGGYFIKGAVSDSDKAPTITPVAYKQKAKSQDGILAGFDHAMKKLGISEATAEAATNRAPATAIAPNTASANGQNGNLGGSVNSAVERVHTHTENQFRHFVIDSYAELGHYNNLKVSHAGNRMSSLKDFNKDASTNDVLEGTWLSAINSHSYRADVWKKLHGMSITDSVSVSPARQLHDIYTFFSHKDLRVNNVRMNGTYANGFIEQSTDQTSTEQSNFNNVRGVQMDVNGESLLVKVGGGNTADGPVCLNLEQLEQMGIVVHPVTPEHSTPVPRSHPGHPKHHPKKHPKRHPQQTHPKKHPQHIPKVIEQPQPKPKTPTKPPKVVVPPHHTPKTDHNTTPAGVPGEPGGTGSHTPATGPGEGPAGQTPSPTGFVPGENHPVTPTSEPTPAPLPVPEGPSPSGGGAETGTDNGPSQPPAGSTGTGTTVPTGDPNPQG